jgi:sugar lactone lactonase YvrE
MNLPFCKLDAQGGCIAVGAAAVFISPNGIAVDSSGNVYVADTFNQRVVKIPAPQIAAKEVFR